MIPEEKEEVSESNSQKDTKTHKNVIIHTMQIEVILLYFSSKIDPFWSLWMN